MTATAVRTSQALAEWTRVFPRHVTESYTSSATFMKQLAVIAFSTITYLKNAFPEDNYTEDQFGGLRIRVLKNKCTDDLAQFLITTMTHAFEAFDKKYLHQMALCFYDNECQLENLMEYYILEFKYMEKGVSLSISSKSRGQEGGLKCTMNDITERTIHLLRTCMVMMSMNNQQLPETYHISLRLYYNEDAPEGYQAPGFVAARQSDDPIGTTFDQTVKFGWVQTPFHALSARTYNKEKIEASCEVIPSQNPPILTQAADEELGSDRSSSTARVCCSCKCIDYDDHMLTCQYCKTQQHAVCYGLAGTVATRISRHCCVDCAAADASRQPTDASLATAQNKACYAIFRRALALCARAEDMSARELSRLLGLNAANAGKLLKVLHGQGVLRQEPRAEVATPIKIHHNRLKVVMKEYIRIDDEDIVNRLVEETFASQEPSDPVGDVLSPLEKVSLHSASNISRVIDPDVNNNNAEDPTLKQYREALVMEKLDDLPFVNSQESLKEFETKATKRKAEGKKNGKAGVQTKKARSNRKSAENSNTK
ncbi:uncharacterized protein LOC113235515 [Hyposmocoma kahamanoa]|uniref:uncharacterized protein LOC113235515 n=1 Tax=Hyposmocoma kahamanoa TaxID=1477025 RepID=UPI000E6D763A|nr:uncharacterized protein LOC113235515 [Hyposmocoma kahamanoa]